MGYFNLNPYSVTNITMAPQHWSAGFDGDEGLDGHVVRDWSLEDVETIHCCSSESVPVGEYLLLKLLEKER